jgi:hypothetical protein
MGALSLGALLLLGALSGCSLFESKDYPDVDYSASVQFDRFVGSNAYDPLAATTGSWDCAYRDAAWDGYDYLTLTNTGNAVSTYGTADGLDSAAPVYRLEVANLIENGNFETSAENWATEDPGTIGSAIRITPTSILFGTGCVRVNLDLNESQTYTTVVRTGYTGFLTNTAYNLFFRYTTTSIDTAKVYVDGVESITASPTGSGVKGYARYTINNGYASAPVIKFTPIDNTYTLYDFYVDNFRVGRSGNMELRLSLTRNDTIERSGVPLDSGTYVFSVWAHSDPLATTVQTPYPVDAFVVKMAPTAESSLSTTSVTYAEATGWHKLTATLKPGALAFDDAATGAVLSLVLDFNQTRPGSVLLARPELVYRADGL